MLLAEICYFCLRNRKGEIGNMSVNRVILLGNVGSEPELRYFEGGRVRARIRLATSEAFRNRQGNRQEHTEWHTVCFWDSSAKLVEQYVHKGSQLYIEGRLRNQRWQDKEGNARSAAEVHVDSFRIIRGTGLPTPTAASATPQGQPAQQQTPSPASPPAQTPPSPPAAPQNQAAGTTLSEPAATYITENTIQEFPF